MHIFLRDTIESSTISQRLSRISRSMSEVPKSSNIQEITSRTDKRSISLQSANNNNNKSSFDGMDGEMTMNNGELGQGGYHKPSFFTLSNGSLLCIYELQLFVGKYYFLSILLYDFFLAIGQPFINSSMHVRACIQPSPNWLYDGSSMNGNTIIRWMWKFTYVIRIRGIRANIESILCGKTALMSKHLHSSQNNSATIRNFLFVVEFESIVNSDGLQDVGLWKF
jgi:hypothetical protein